MSTYATDAEITHGAIVLRRPANAVVQPYSSHGSPSPTSGQIWPPVYRQADG